MIRTIIAIIIKGLLAGVAYTAGSALWDNVLENKVRKTAKDLKDKKEQKKKIVKFKKVKSS